MKSYDHKKIERKWQAKWAEDNSSQADDSSSKPKKYVLDMFPYPSGDGLHMGHVENYTATCIYSRYMRMKGFNVLHPIGWDAFGLPAENYAIKTGVHPNQKTHENIKNFTRQIKELGFSYDWSREIDTSSPEYYKWTQWFFLLLYKNGLAFKKMAKVNWCDSCQTVLANEQAVGGVCERCGNPVRQKDLAQWFFKITDFAEDLISGLDGIDWPESTKLAQKNWIGKSEGASIKFKIKNSGLEIEVFTTRPDTLFGATYMVVAPEYVAKLKEQNPEIEIGNWAEVAGYLELASKKTNLERMAQVKDKTGVKIEGLIAINPANDQEIPIFVADYVLGDYGTGAIMAVPAHDERDWEFAKKFNLPIIEVIGGGDVNKEAYIGAGPLVNSEQLNGLNSEEAKKKITESVGGEMKTTYRLRDWLVSRQRYWGAPIPIIYCEKCGELPVPEADLPVLLPTDVDFRPTGESPLAYSKTFHDVKCPKCGEPARRESDTMDTFVCSSWYFFRYTDPRNDKEFASREKLNYWMGAAGLPRSELSSATGVDMYMGGAEHTVLHLLYARFFTKVLQKLGYIDFGEPFLTLRHQGLILAEDGSKMSKSKGNVVNPDQIAELYGADTIRLFEMFMGPLEDAKPWNSQSIIGSRRFLERVWRLQEKVKEGAPADTELDYELNSLIEKAGTDIETMSFNTAISAMMIYVNKLDAKENFAPDYFEKLLMVLAPFAPHMTEELWHDLGHTDSVHTQEWPEADKSKLTKSRVNITVQVNGRVRDNFEAESEASEEEVTAVALEREAVKRWLAGQEIKKVVYVKGKLINLVTN